MLGPLSERTAEPEDEDEETADEDDLVDVARKRKQECYVTHDMKSNCVTLSKLQENNGKIRKSVHFYQLASNPLIRVVH